MKSTITLSTTYKAVLIFTFIFAAFLTLSITYNRVYKLKNETMSIIEKYEGVTKKSIGIVNNYLKNSGYGQTGNCLEDEYGVKDLELDSGEPAQSGEKYYYCYKKNGTKNNVYYNITLFYRFNLPFLGDLMTYRVTGVTKSIRIK